ncbi:hypothetical protein ACMT1E_02830 [Sphingomonas flavalba]|uniref:hypothetical protein n=1 Tax=Sphingomonas flavalba TaxID=2559804 RepID=UPI0039E1DA40
MTRPRPLARISALALASIAGIAGMLPAEGGWDLVLFAFAALPLLLGGGVSIARRLRTGRWR